MFKFKREDIVVDFGELYDKTKVVSPDILKISDNEYCLYYVGTNCAPNERKDYRLLVATSNDGVKFSKINKPILNLLDPSHKHYSPKVVKTNENYRLYYGLGAEGKYIINSAISSSPFSFNHEKGVRIDIDNQHTAAVHSPKIIFKNNLYHCFYTGSNNKGKIYSHEYPEHDFGTDFKIHYSRSKDGIHFTYITTLDLSPSLVNYYGHNVCVIGKTIYLIFSGFDGAINRLYLTSSQDFINFQLSKVILEPIKKNNEIGLYSNTILPMSDSVFRVFFGVRNIDNRWRIHSGLLNIK